ncbi:MAG TPA: response regulator [Anaerolineae bacterium]|nr:response regulator [Anaerolineae bacterium]HOR00590.1 response regulator [Anaerolineae bacterium]HPL27726.1 response regulator [Anaerolineae bacterium]
MRILIVDDDESILDFVCEAVADEGHEALTATDGAIALDLTRTQPPDLILLDMRMPIVDGWAFAEAYQARPGPHAPLVVMTAARDAADIANDIHAAGYLAKPFALDDLLAVVERFQRRSHVEMQSTRRLQQQARGDGRHR